MGSFIKWQKPTKRMDFFKDFLIVFTVN
jgi:hypothetical protein